MLDGCRILSYFSIFCGKIHVFLVHNFKENPFSFIFVGSPRLLSLRILGSCVEGTKLTAEKKYWGGEEGSSIYRWFLVRGFIYLFLVVSINIIS